MAKSGVVTFPTPEFKFPKFDLDALFATQTANLAAVHEVQNVLTDAAQAIVKVQHGYLEQAAADTKAALTVQELPKAETVLANAKARIERAIAVAKEVNDLAIGVQQHVYEILSRRGQASVDELKAVAA